MYRYFDSFFPSVTFVVTIQMQSIVPSPDQSPGISASHLPLSGLHSHTFKSLCSWTTTPKHTHTPTDNRCLPARECVLTGELPHPSPGPPSPRYPELSGSRTHWTPLLHTPAAFNHRGKSQLSPAVNAFILSSTHERKEKVTEYNYWGDLSVITKTILILSSLVLFNSVFPEV